MNGAEQILGSVHVRRALVQNVSVLDRGSDNKRGQIGRGSFRPEKSATHASLPRIGWLKGTILRHEPFVGPTHIGVLTPRNGCEFASEGYYWENRTILTF